MKHKYTRLINKWTNTANKYDGYISLVAGLTLLLIGLILFLLGFHNFDLGQNFQFLESVINKYQLRNNLSEESLFYETTIDSEVIFDFSDVYRQGIKQAGRGFIIALLGAIFIGYGLRDYYGNLQ